MHMSTHLLAENFVWTHSHAYKNENSFPLLYAWICMIWPWFLNFFGIAGHSFFPDNIHDHDLEQILPLEFSYSTHFSRDGKFTKGEKKGNDQNFHTSQVTLNLFSWKQVLFVYRSSFSSCSQNRRERYFSCHSTWMILGIWANWIHCIIIKSSIDKETHCYRARGWFKHDV